MVFLEPFGPRAAISLVRPNPLLWTLVYLDAAGAVPSADVAHFYSGLSIVVYEDERGSATDHDIRAREFRWQAIEYADFDNNGWGSAFVWRPGGSAYFYYNNDLSSGSPPATSVQFGTTGDIPARMDYNGDGITDLAVFRPSSGTWYIDFNLDGIANRAIQFGTSGDTPVPGDYDGDGRTDLAVFRPSNGTWYIRYSATAATTSVQFGTNGDIPVPADYSGDFRTDIAVWRPSTGFWYVDANLNGIVDFQAQFGTAGDIPVPGDYGPSGVSAPDGMAELAVFRPSTGYWYVSRNRDGVVSQATQFGTSGDIPVGGVYDSSPNINSPFAVFRPSSGTWYVDRDNNGTVDISSQFGAAGDTPLQQPSGQYRH
jgi:spore coat protein A, manganese oxidase